MRRIAPLALLISLAACANTSSVVTPGTGGPTSSGDPLATRQLDAHEAVIRHLVGDERTAWQTIYLMDRICANAGSGMEAKDCEAVPVDEQEQLRSRLADLGSPIRFVHDYEEADPDGQIIDGSEHSVFVWFGPVSDGPEGSLEVPGSMGCGGLCGTGSVWKLQEREGAWTVVGTVEGASTRIA